MKTIIDGSTDKQTIHHAVDAYMEGLNALAFPENFNTVLGAGISVERLKKAFAKSIRHCTAKTEDIVYELNIRAQELESDRFRELSRKDKALWQREGGKNPLFGVLACVDKGVPAEAIGVDISNVGRTLAGDIGFSYIPSTNSFHPVPSALVKRLIHYGRQGKTVLVEPLIEHTSCGRRAQILANEGHTRIPSIGFIFDHIGALTTEFGAGKSMVAKKLQQVNALWLSYQRVGPSVTTPDAGLWVGVVQKIAQRQALSQLSRDIRIVSPIEVYEKDTGDLIAGLDRIDVLTDATVLSHKGFTRDVVSMLAKNKKIFSLKGASGDVFSAIEKSGATKPGAFTYTRLRTHWLSGVTAMQGVTATLWKLFDNGDRTIATFVTAYFTAWRGTDADANDPIDRRIIHHLFHVTAYAYVLDTFARGHEPGKHHIEEYLATGDHEIGTKPHIALGQGDLDRPEASEIFTGYSVLLHSTPGHEGTPIPVTIKLDTDRTEHQPMSTEETNVALEDLSEFLKLWPYFLVGDLIPVLMVRGKASGGISRLGLSVLKAFGDIAIMYEQPDSPLPRFVPANNGKGEVVLVPAVKVLEEGANAGSLATFRHNMVRLADHYSDTAVQQSFAASSL